MRDKFEAQNIIYCFEHTDISYKLFHVLKNNPERFEREILRINKKLGWEVIKKNWQRYITSHYVGVLQIQNMIIYILPKIFACYDSEPVVSEDEKLGLVFRNFLSLLNYAGEIQLKDSDLTHFGTLKAPFHEFMIFIFAKNLCHLLKDNLLRDYERKRDELSFIRGKIIFKKMHNQIFNPRVICEYFDYTSDIILHRILKFSTYLFTFIVYNNSTQNYLKEILSLYNTVKLDPQSIYKIDKVKFTKLNESFKVYLNFVKIFLSNLSFNFTENKVESFTFIFDMNRLYEKFMSNFIKKHWLEISRDIEYLKDTTVSLQYEIKDGLYGIVKPLIPDIVIRKKDKVLLIIDTKYKLQQSEPQREDCYQMYVYSKKLKCKKALIIYPSIKKEEGIKKAIDRDNNGEFELFWASVNLNIDLLKEKNQLINQIKDVIKQVVSLD